MTFSFTQDLNQDTSTGMFLAMENARLLEEELLERLPILNVPVS